MFDRLKAAMLPIASAAGELFTHFGRLAVVIGKDVADAFTLLDPKLRGVDGTIARIVQGLADAIGKAGSLIRTVSDYVGQEEAQTTQQRAAAATASTGPGAAGAGDGPAPAAEDRSPQTLNGQIQAARAELVAARAKLREDVKWTSYGAGNEYPPDAGYHPTTNIDQARAADADLPGAEERFRRARSRLASAEQIADAMEKLQVARGVLPPGSRGVLDAQAAYNEAVRRSNTPYGGLDPRPLLPAAPSPSPAAATPTASSAVPSPLPPGTLGPPAPGAPPATAGAATIPPASVPRPQTLGPPQPPQPLGSPRAVPSVPVAPPSTTTIAQNLAALKAAATPKPPRPTRAARTQQRPAAVAPRPPAALAAAPPPAVARSAASATDAPAVGVPPVDLSSVLGQLGRLGDASAAAARSVDGLAAAMAEVAAGVRQMVNERVAELRPPRPSDGGSRQIAAGPDDGRPAIPVTVNQRVNVSIDFDPRETVTQLAAKLLPRMREVYAQAESRLQGAAMAALAGASMGGNT